MPEIKEHSLKEFRLRARLPQVFRYGAVAILAVTILAVIVGFYRERGKEPFKIKSEHTKLSKDVVAEVNNYERLETDGGLSKYYIKADFARTFSDDHQELQNVYLKTYDDQGGEADTLSAVKALYIPEENKGFTAYLNGDVKINTRDRLQVKTNNATYTKKTETAESDEKVEFERDNIRGSSFGAVVKIGERRVELLKDVDIETFESAELLRSGVSYSHIRSGSAVFDQASSQIELKTSVAIDVRPTVKPGSQPTEDNIRAERAVVLFEPDAAGGNSANSQVRSFELFDDVHIVTKENGAQTTLIDSGYALFNKRTERYELKNGSHIVLNANLQPTDIKANETTYDQAGLKFVLNGNAEITQSGDYLKGQKVDADLFADKKLKYAVISGDAFVRQTAADRTTSVSAPEINATWGGDRLLQAANTSGNSLARLEPKDPVEYSLVTMAAPNAIHLLFKGEGLLTSLKTDGRTTIQLNAAGKDTDAANKRVTADNVNTFFFDNGKDIRRAEAIGNAELYVEPLKATVDNYQTTINAPRFDCDFYPTGSNAKVCVGGKKTKTVRVRTVAVEGRGTQTLLGDQITVGFGEASKDVERMDATGNAKFTELDRAAVANQMTFTQADATVRLRGGEPTAWDASSRAKAKEIDWDTKNKRSQLRGGVSTTYYSRNKMGDAAPFAASDKPVFVTSDSADFDHAAETSLYIGNARGWQENNYVRGDRLFIKQREGKMFAEGSVQSVLYDAKQKVGAKDASVPVFASSRTLAYDRDTRLLQYNENTDIRQGTDRLTAGKTDVYLTEKNEVGKTIAEKSVVLTQPGRRATGDWVQYTSADEVAILRGTPAQVTDAENGTSQAAELTFLMREHRVLSEGKPKPNGNGRLRNVYKVKPAQ